MLDLSAVAIQISFLIMAVKWSKLAKECDRFDFYMKSYGFPKYLKLKSYIVFVTFVGLSFGKFYSVIFVTTSRTMYSLQLSTVFSV